MNEVIKALKERRSIKKYKKDSIPDEILDAVLEAATFAPTGMNRQSPVMVVIKDKEQRDALSKLNASIMGMNGDPFYGAPVVVVVLADSNILTYKEDGSLVMGNLLNAAHSVGLGSCWIHRAKEEFETPEGKKMLEKWGIPENYVGVGHCILGYADEEREVRPRKEGYIIRV